MIDDTDREILTFLQRDGRISNAEIARQVGMAPSAILERIRKLEERGVVRGYEARLDPKHLGLGLVAFIFVRADDRPGTLCTGDRLAKIPGVHEVHQIAGEDCYLVKIRARDTEHLGRLLREQVSAVKGVRSTRTTIALNTLKESGEIPLGAAEEVQP